MLLRCIRDRAIAIATTGPPSNRQGMASTSSVGGCWSAPSRPGEGAGFPWSTCTRARCASGMRRAPASNRACAGWSAGRWDRLRTKAAPSAGVNPPTEPRPCSGHLMESRERGHRCPRPLDDNGHPTANRPRRSCGPSQLERERNATFTASDASARAQLGQAAARTPAQDRDLQLLDFRLERGHRLEVGRKLQVEE